MPNSNVDLDDLINEPRETLDVEVKEWLDLTDNDHRAMIAKEVIALANHGGGFLVIDFQEGADGTFQPSAGRPINLDAWSQDGIQSIVAKYTCCWDSVSVCVVIEHGDGDNALLRQWRRGRDRRGFESLRAHQ